jgi:hypothetical protein
LNISRRPSTASNLEASEEVTNEISNIRSNSGSPLDSSTKEFMESRFGHDFSKVKIHTDETAVRSPNLVDALAYTIGNDIVFGQGQYQPDTSQGRRLLAHELTHTLQQTYETNKTVYREPQPPTISGGSQGPPSRRIYIDGSVIDQIYRGNFQAGNALRQMLSSGAEVYVPAQIYDELVNNPGLPRTASANRVLLDELGIRKGPATTLAQRVPTYETNITKIKSGSTVLGADDARLVAEARAGGGEVWSFDRAFRKDPNNVEQSFGVRVSPESQLPLAPHGKKADYRLGRQILRLPPRDISRTGVVSEPTRLAPMEPAARTVGGEIGGSRGGTPPIGPSTPPAGPTREPMQESPSRPSATSQEPKPSVVAHPSTRPSTSPPIAVTGEVKTGQATIEYDFSKGKSETKLKSINLSDYPPDKQGKITGFFRDKPVLSHFASVAASAGIQYASDKALQAIESHYSKAIQGARKEFLDKYPTRYDLLQERGIAELEEEYNAAMDKIESLGFASIQEMLIDPKGWIRDLKGAFEYQHAMTSLQEQIYGLKEELSWMADDIQNRANVLRRMARNLEEAFIWIHSNLVGSIPIVYYQSFTLWSVMGTLRNLGDRLGNFSGDIQKRKREYGELYESLDKELDEISPTLKPYWELYRKEIIESLKE